MKRTPHDSYRNHEVAPLDSVTHPHGRWRHLASITKSRPARVSPSHRHVSLSSLYGIRSIARGLYIRPPPGTGIDHAGQSKRCKCSASRRQGRPPRFAKYTPKRWTSSVLRTSISTFVAATPGPRKMNRSARVTASIAPRFRVPPAGVLIFGGANELNASRGKQYVPTSIAATEQAVRGPAPGGG